MKRHKTHNRYFPTFEALIDAVDAGLTKFQNDAAAVKQLDVLTAKLIENAPSSIGTFLLA